MRFTHPIKRRRSGAREHEVEKGAYLGRRQVPRRMISKEWKPLFGPLREDLNQLAAYEHATKAELKGL